MVRLPKPPPLEPNAPPRRWSWDWWTEPGTWQDDLLVFPAAIILIAIVGVVYWLANL
jgi:hypothetical protein